ncbi:MAG: M1 family metallopeptidase [Cyclobacteriaceae bacterium]
MKLNSYIRLVFSVLVLYISTADYSCAQFTRVDTLRGSITPEREWWDLSYYHLEIDVDIDNKYLSGKNRIEYKVLSPQQILQLDMQSPMVIDSVVEGGRRLKLERDGIAYFVQLIKEQNIEEVNRIDVYFSGNPTEAVNPPWDGGVAWKLDKKGKPWVATACQGIGASTWWPCKDHAYDEPDSMKVSVTVPEELTVVSNGRLLKTEEENHKQTYHWSVTNPINNYGVNINIGNYVNFSETYQGEGGTLDMDYWVLKHNLGKAKKQFKQTIPTLQAMEHWFGPYPFYEDSYKLVEAPYLGMEHQSSVTYGNEFKNGYRGMDLSGTGWGMKFDYIIVHESGHEWFGNNITYTDEGDLWIHEAFTCYSEGLFVEYHYGKQAGSEYVLGLRDGIKNDGPIIGPYGVNALGSKDMYSKGANMLHTLRQLVDNDTLWRNVLRGLNKDFFHQVVSTAQVEDYISEQVRTDLSGFFDQYLRSAELPVFEYYKKDDVLLYRWTNCNSSFDMPLRVFVGANPLWLGPNTDWQQISISGNSNVTVDQNFYIMSIYSPQ